MKTKMIVIWSGYIFLLMSAFNNCVNSEHESLQGTLLGQSAQACEVHLRRVFNSSVHGFVANNCAACHADGPGFGVFANTDVGLAYESFVGIGWDKVQAQAVSDVHRPPATGSHLTGQAAQISQAWSQAQANYDSCLSSSVNVNPEFRISTVPIEMRTEVDRWQEIFWDLSSEISSVSNTSIALTFKVEVRPYFGELSETLTDEERDSPETNGVNPNNPFSVIQYRGLTLNDAIGYVFRNPRFEFHEESSVRSYYIEGLEIVVNGQLGELFDAWRELDLLKQGEQDNDGNWQPSVLIDDDQREFIYLFENPQYRDRMAVEFYQIIDASNPENAPFIPRQTDETGSVEKPVIDRIVTYAELTSATGVFTTQCLSCHNNSNASGGLNLEDEVASQNNSDEIQRRINGQGGIMPPSGSMTGEEIAIIEKWISDGFPSN